jgi:hypothetical protein
MRREVFPRFNRYNLPLLAWEQMQPLAVTQEVPTDSGQ